MLGNGHYQVPSATGKHVMTREMLYRGYYTAVRRYEFYPRVVKTIFYERAQRVSKILFSP